MKRIPMLFSGFYFLGYFILKENLQSFLWASCIFILPISVLLINLYLRKSLRFKFWFVKILRPILEQSIIYYESDITFDLLFLKIQELITNSEDLRLFESDFDSRQILFATKVNGVTWGENVYLSFKEIDNKVLVEFCSTTIFGNSSWNRNALNYERFKNDFENALVI